MASRDPTPLSIASVSELLDVPVPTLRSWEVRYGTVDPIRTPGGHRRYTASDVERLKRMRDEIVRGARAADAARNLTSAKPGPAEGARYRERMLAAAMVLDGYRLRRVLDEAAVNLGIEAALTNVVLAGMAEVGDRWKIGVCDVAHEHLASNEVRSWLVRYQSLLPTPLRKGVIVLACAPEEHHSIGLEAFAMLMTMRGRRCVTLGPRTPVGALSRAVEQVEPVAVVVACQYTGARRSAAEMIRAVPRGVRVYCGGAGFASPSARKGLESVYLGDDVVTGAATLDRRLRR